jgi:hypothetical protein
VTIGWRPYCLLAGILLLTALIYWPGLAGGYLFDDYPNIVDNHALQIKHLDYQSLKAAALSSPSSDLKRPLAYISFAINEYFAGLDPGPMKTVNLIIHLFNAMLLYFVVLMLMRMSSRDGGEDKNGEWRGLSKNELLALTVTMAWALAPINFTPVLFIVQRMESMANLFVLGGILAYLGGRKRQTTGRNGRPLIALSFVFAGAGLLAKETTILLPLYVMLIEWALLRWNCANVRTAKTLAGLHWSMLAAGTIGALYLVPRFFAPGAYAMREFTVGQRLLTETRILWDYIEWTLLPNLGRLGFYYDDLVVSGSLTQPLSTLLAILGLVILAAAAVALRKKIPMISLGITWFLAAHILTATVFPLELVFEHRNYFASAGLILAIVSAGSWMTSKVGMKKVFVALAVAWIAWLGFVTCLRALEWQSPVRLAESLAAKQPGSARTLYELGRIYLIVSKYDPSSPFTLKGRNILERAAKLDGASPLAEQALLIQSAHLGQQEGASWWTQIDDKIRSRPLGPQEVQSLYTLVQCSVQKICKFSPDRMQGLLEVGAARGNTEIIAIYANYEINVLGDREGALALAQRCVKLEPQKGQYRKNLIILLEPVYEHSYS